MVDSGNQATLGVWIATFRPVRVSLDRLPWDLSECPDCIMVGSSVANEVTY